MRTAGTGGKTFIWHGFALSDLGHRPVCSFTPHRNFYRPWASRGLGVVGRQPARRSCVPLHETAIPDPKW